MHGQAENTLTDCFTDCKIAGPIAQLGKGLLEVQGLWIINGGGYLRLFEPALQLCAMGCIVCKNTVLRPGAMIALRNNRAPDVGTRAEHRAISIGRLLFCNKYFEISVLDRATRSLTCDLLCPDPYFQCKIRSLNHRRTQFSFNGLNYPCNSYNKQL